MARPLELEAARRIGIVIEAEHQEKARKLGGGNVSAGIRHAIDVAWREREDRIRRLAAAKQGALLP